jgi:hypothetical protein
LEYHKIFQHGGLGDLDTWLCVFYPTHATRNKTFG